MSAYCFLAELHSTYLIKIHVHTLELKVGRSIIASASQYFTLRQLHELDSHA